MERMERKTKSSNSQFSTAVSNITPHRNETVTGTWQTLMSDTTFVLSITHVRKIEGTPCQVLVTCFMRCRYLPFALASLKSACPQRVDRVGRRLCVLRCLAVQAKLQSTDWLTTAVSNITPHRNETVTGTWQTLMSDTTFALSITHVRKIEGTPCQVLVTCFMRCRYLPFALASLKSACPQRVNRVGRRLCVLRCLAVQAKLQSTDWVALCKLHPVELVWWETTLPPKPKRRCGLTRSSVCIASPSQLS